MPVGDDFYPYSFTFQDGDVLVGVAMNSTFVTRVLGCEGNREELQACVMSHQDALKQEALSKKSTWTELPNGMLICSLGLSGIPIWDEGKSFPCLGWPTGDAHTTEEEA